MTKPLEEQLEELQKEVELGYIRRIVSRSCYNENCRGVVHVFIFHGKTHDFIAQCNRYKYCDYY